VGYPAYQFNQSLKDKIMKDKSSRLISSARCQHRTATGRQCSSLAGDRSSGLCPRHAVASHTSSPNFREALTRNAFDFQRAQGLNNSLGVLYGLLAEGHISPRRASVLAYISSLLLRTLPAIDYDNDHYPDDDAEPNSNADAEEQNSPESVASPAAQPVPPGKEPLPKTAEEFANVVLNRKPN
jgi:hypothetical protein